MDRRGFLVTTAGLRAAPFVAEAQQASMVKIGWLAPEPKPFALAPFRQVLKESGWIEGDNLLIEPRYSHAAIVRYRELAAELVRLRVDAIVTDGTPATRAAQQATARIPIVFFSSSPVEQGELNPKRIEFLKNAVPGMERLAVLEDEVGVGLAATSIRVAGNWAAVEAASRQLGIADAPQLAEARWPGRCTRACRR